VSISTGCSQNCAGLAYATISGIFCSPLEIENALLAHPAIAEICVVGRDDKDGFSGSEQLAAELKLWVKDRMAPHKYPRWFEWRASLPKNDRGKVARKELRDEVSRAG
jgi:benzoate-CoA ligase